MGAIAGKCSAPPPPNSFCKHDAKVNACVKCSTDADCGGEESACWGQKDFACPNTQLPWASVTGNEAACSAEFKCCLAGPTFCHEKHDSSSFCEPSTPAQQQIGDGCSCPYGSKAIAGKCSAVPPPTPSSCPEELKCCTSG